MHLYKIIMESYQEIITIPFVFFTFKNINKPIILEKYTATCCIKYLIIKNETV